MRHTSFSKPTRRLSRLFASFAGQAVPRIAQISLCLAVCCWMAATTVEATDSTRSPQKDAEGGKGGGGGPAEKKLPAERLQAKKMENLKAKCDPAERALIEAVEPLLAKQKGGETLTQLAHRNGVQTIDADLLTSASALFEDKHDWPSVGRLTKLYLENRKPEDNPRQYAEMKYRFARQEVIAGPSLDEGLAALKDARKAAVDKAQQDEIQKTIKALEAPESIDDVLLYCKYYHFLYEGSTRQEKGALMAGRLTSLRKKPFVTDYLADETKPKEGRADLALGIARSLQYSHQDSAVVSWCKEMKGRFDDLPAFRDDLQFHEAHAFENLKRYDDALAEYKTLAAEAELPSVRASALYQMGFIESRRYDYERAAALFQQVIDQFPDTDAAKSAQSHLAQVQRLIASGVMRPVGKRTGTPGEPRQ